MYRQPHARPLRHARTTSPRTRGFTMVELLVVIAIIAMLVGLLIPAVMRAREAGRRNQCLNNQRQIGTAVVNYVTEKNKFPPLFTAQVPIPPTGDPTPVGWVPTMLPYLEQNPLYQVFQQNAWNTLQDATVSTLVCPSRNPTNSPAPLSYVPNAGMTDVFRPDEPLDYRENGVFFDDYARQMRTISSPRPPTFDMSYLSRNDGNAMTLLLSENLDTYDWIEVFTSGTMAPNLIPRRPSYVPNEAVGGWWQSYTWRNDNPPMPGAATPNNWGLDNIFPSGQVLNKPLLPAGLNPALPSPNAVQRESLDFYRGRPSSNHPGGFITTMCDGSARFMSEEISFRLFCMLASPDSAGTKLPRDGSAVVYPADWYVGGNLIPITAADVQ